MTASLLRSHELRETLAQAVLLSPMFAARWRWNLGRALAVLRFRGGRKNPPPIQRMEATTSCARSSPGSRSVRRTRSGPIELPDHPDRAPDDHDCLHEALDVDGAIEIALAVERARSSCTCATRASRRRSRTRSCNSKPYTVPRRRPLEERRTRAVEAAPRPARGGARPRRGSTTPRSRACATRPALAPRDADELHDALLSLVVLAGPSAG
jgi:ATP-dependent Lhr-like helicase